MIIRALTTADATQYRGFMLRAYAQVPDAFTSTPEEPAAMPLAWWAKRVADPDGQGIAFGAFTEDGQLASSVALEFTARTKTRPHASASRSSRLTAAEGNVDAIALYESAGFCSFGLEPMAIRTPGGYKGKAHMWKAVPELGGDGSRVEPATSA